MDARTLVERQIAAHERAAEADLEAFRKMSMAERGRRLIAVCRTAAVIRDSRVRSGLPPVEREPVPEAALEILSPRMRRERVAES